MFSALRTEGNGPSWDTTSPSQPGFYGKGTSGAKHVRSNPVLERSPLVCVGGGTFLEGPPRLLHYFTLVL